MVRPATRLHDRHHKKHTFTPLMQGDKRTLKHELVKKRTLETPDGRTFQGRLADHVYFRIYKHKGQPYTLYIDTGPKKESHGGLRVKSKTGDKTKSIRLASKAKKAGRAPSAPKITDTDDILSDYREIESGPHSGKFKNIKTGDILSERQLRILIATRGGR